MFRQPAGDHVLHPIADVHGMVAHPFVVAADQGKLHSRLKVHGVALMGFEYGLDEVGMQFVEAVVHVIKGSGEGGVAFGVGIHTALEQPDGLFPHLLDETSQTGIQRGAVNPAGCLGHVHHEIAGTLNL